MQEISIKSKKNHLFYCKGDGALEQVSAIGAIQNSTEHNPSSLLCMTLL